MSLVSHLGSVASSSARNLAQQDQKLEPAAQGGTAAPATAPAASRDSFVSARAPQGSGTVFDKIVETGREALQGSSAWKDLAPAAVALQQAMSTGFAPEQNRDLDAANRRTLAPTAPQSTDLTLDPGFQALPKAAREKLVREASRPGAAEQLEQVAQHPLYAELSATQRAQFLNVFATADARGRAALPLLMGREVLAGSGPAPAAAPALLSGDNTRQSASLLENLDKLARQSLPDEVLNRRGEILGRLIEETSDPRRHLDQGWVGTCASTSTQAHLLQGSPAEYVRMIGGLVGPGRQAVLADGQVLKAAQNDLARKPTVPDPDDPAKSIPDTRTVTERVFQSALQQFGKASTGRAMTFDANTNNTGQWINESTNILSAVYNRPFVWSEIKTEGAKNVPGGFMDQKSAMYSQIEQDIRAGHGPVRVDLMWGAAGADGSHGAHALLVTDIRDGQVLLRNPHGSSDERTSLQDGAEMQNPPRRVQDAQGSIESMKVEDFKRWLSNSTSGVPVGGQR